MQVRTKTTSANQARVRNPFGEGSRLRDELIEAAGRLLAAGSEPEALSLRAVAREAGVSAPSVYLQFDSKDALLRAVVDANFAVFQRAILDGARTGNDPAVRLLDGFLAYCRFAIEHPGAYRVIFETPLPAWPDLPVAELPGMDAFRVLVNGVTACIDSGVARPGDPFLIAVDIWVALHGLVTLRQRLPGFPWPPLESQVVGLLRDIAGINTLAPDITGAC